MPPVMGLSGSATIFSKVTKLYLGALSRQLQLTRHPSLPRYGAKHRLTR
jgi:hypothetical protein